MKISIALASYNGEQFIQEQLDSFIRQTRMPDELIISDDGSQDGTLDIVKAFRESAPFEVRILRNQENLGYAGNFNRALCATTGDLVFLSDQDDVWFPEKLERMEKFSRANPNALVVMCDAALTDTDLNPVGLTKIGQIRSAGMDLSKFYQGCCIVIRREFLDTVLPIPAGYPAHDLWIVKIADGIYAKKVLEENLQYYRRHETNVSGFIANQTTSITPGQIRWRRYRRLLGLDNRPEKTPSSTIDELKQLREGVLMSAERCDPKWRNAFWEFSKRLNHCIQSLEKRWAIRCASLPRRVIGALLHWWQGGYANVSGLKSAIRDIFFPS